VEGEDKRSFTGKVGEEDDFGTFPDLSVANEFSLSISRALIVRQATYRLKLVLMEVRNGIDD